MSQEVSVYPRTFDYEVPKSLEGALDVWLRGDEVRALAAGRSLTGRARPRRVNR